MTITKASFSVQLKQQLGTISDKLTLPQIDASVSTALRELGWTLPVTHNTKEYWLIERAKRHCLFILMIESAHKIRYKELHLQNRFNQYKDLIYEMDQSFEKAMEANPSLFSSVNALDGGSGEGFISFIPAGFSYNDVGHDTTYDVSGPPKPFEGN